ncbi:T-cell immunomodulatory protein-like, partial [Clarias magur]
MVMMLRLGPKSLPVYGGALSPGCSRYHSARYHHDTRWGECDQQCVCVCVCVCYSRVSVCVCVCVTVGGVSVISSVVPADYDGDSQMDVLLTGHGSDLQHTKVFVFWGNNQTLNQSERVDLNRTFNDQPLVMDFNGDMIPDIFGTVGKSTEVCYLRDRKLRCERALGSDVQIRVPHSNAFINLNKDFTADLFLSTGSNPVFEFETWINTDGNFTKNYTLKAPENIKRVGQSAFVDFDGDGSQDHLLPVCMDDACTKSAIYLSKPGEPE